MKLIDIVLEVERILKEHNITWRYVSSRNTRTFILEDGTSTVLTMRYDPVFDNYLIHITNVVEGKVNLVTKCHIIYGVESVEDIMQEII